MKKVNDINNENVEKKNKWVVSTEVIVNTFVG